MKLSPRKAKEDQIIKLNSDNHSTDNGWILLNGNGKGDVTLTNQRVGQESTGTVHFSKREFNKLIDWYNREQNV